MPMRRQGRQGDRRLETGGRGLETGGQETGDRRQETGETGGELKQFESDISLSISNFISRRKCVDESIVWLSPSLSASGALFAVMHWKYPIVKSLFELNQSSNWLPPTTLFISIEICRGRVFWTIWSGIKLLSCLCLSDVCGRRPEVSENSSFIVGQDSWERFSSFPFSIKIILRTWPFHVNEEM